MDYYSLYINISDKLTKELVTDYAFELGCMGTEDLDESHFENEEQGNGLKLYFPQNSDKGEIVGALQKYLASKVTDFNIEVEDIEKQDWLEKWKENYKPIEADKFLVVPIWMADIETELQKILIEPKMAFGTGTHETTRMMLEFISKMNFDGKSVLDAGCGSGILGIAAKMLGAESVLGIDVEQESVDNSQENADHNKVSLRSELASDDAYSTEYDVLFANINRSILVDLMSDFKRALKNGGELLLSGILVDEKHLIYEVLNDVGGFTEVEYKEMGEWCSIKLNFCR